MVMAVHWAAWSKTLTLLPPSGRRSSLRLSSSALRVWPKFKVRLCLCLILKGFCSSFCHVACFISLIKLRALMFLIIKAEFYEYFENYRSNIFKIPNKKPNNLTVLCIVNYCNGIWPLVKQRQGQVYFFYSMKYKCMAFTVLCHGEVNWVLFTADHLQTNLQLHEGLELFQYPKRLSGGVTEPRGKKTTWGFTMTLLVNLDFVAGAPVFTSLWQSLMVEFGRNSSGFESKGNKYPAL